MTDESFEAGGMRDGSFERASEYPQAPLGTSNTAISWMKVPLIGCPGTECGRELLEGGETRPMESFQAEFGVCDEAGRWMAGGLLLCDKHAAIVAEEFGDSLDEIRKAIAEMYGWETA